MTEIALTRGLVALVDDADAQLVSAHKWSVLPHKHNEVIYAKTTIRKDSGGARSTLLMHRLILGITNPSLFVDHINYNGLDNRRANLRVATRAENSVHRRSQSRNNKHGLVGVVYIPKIRRYRAQISIGGVPSYLGSFFTAEEAHARYVDEGRRLFGEFFPL